MTRLEFLRRSQNLTIATLARAAGVRGDTISQVERGMRPKRSPILEKLAAVLKVPANTLLLEVEARQPRGVDAFDIDHLPEPAK